MLVSVSKIAGEARWGVDGLYSTLVGALTFSNHSDSFQHNQRTGRSTGRDSQMLVLENIGAGGGGVHGGADSAFAGRHSMFASSASDVLRSLWNSGVWVGFLPLSLIGKKKQTFLCNFWILFLYT